MTAIFKQRGDTINYVPTSYVSAGDVVVQEDLIGIAKLDINSGPDRKGLILSFYPKNTVAQPTIETVGGPFRMIISFFHMERKRRKEA